MSKTPIIRSEDNELLGFITEANNSWDSLTVFGYAFAQGLTKSEAENLVRSKGLEILLGRWQYFDQTSQDWADCIIVEAAPGYLRVAPFDGVYPDTTKILRITGDALNKIRL